MSILLRRILGFLLNPLLALILRYLPVDDPWERFPYSVPLRIYGGGAQRDFGWYFEGQSSVSATSIEEIQDWLIGCEYAEDMDLFQERDFWQHPRTFEQLRRGDCEDHALWAWRKLVELGYDAELVSVQQLSKSGVSEKASGHVWVVFKQGDETFLFETAAKSKDRMLQPLQNVRAEYRPEAGVDAAQRRFAYYGYLLTLKEGRARRKVRGTA